MRHRNGSAGINLDGVPVTLLDTAGVREAVDAAERMGVERSQAAARAADIAILVIDAQVSALHQDASRRHGREERSS